MSDPSAKAVEKENVKQPSTALYSINQGQHDVTAPIAMYRDRAREKAIAGRGDRMIVTVPHNAQTTAIVSHIRFNLQLKSHDTLRKCKDETMKLNGRQC